jgi:hypothetical protein
MHRFWQGSSVLLGSDTSGGRLVPVRLEEHITPRFFSYLDPFGRGFRANHVHYIIMTASHRRN